MANRFNSAFCVLRSLSRTMGGISRPCNGTNVGNMQSITRSLENGQLLNIRWLGAHSRIRMSPQRVRWCADDPFITTVED